jgi:RNA polymerase sigma-70 factor, ECF subfamily
MSESKSVTQLLNNWGNGDETALERIIPLVYDELRKIAASMNKERPSHTLQATALINEAYVRLVDQQSVQWHGRIHFYRTAAQIMRNEPD